MKSTRAASPSWIQCQGYQPDDGHVKAGGLWSPPKQLALDRIIELRTRRLGHSNILAQCTREHCRYSPP
ncbi:hypothetical protein G6O67_000747 [Ophiocordyceps sinensis]|uniref:Uncharacterized protein n=1 Tax=Ophiocordyceps sinensis TaxID=72228 RepID=A0A8H4Q025_9HYPO|nr:hypothetical protein G6O67_000747 [Ophiocordyceps sinensis]